MTTRLSRFLGAVAPFDTLETWVISKRLD